MKAQSLTLLVNYDYMHMNSQYVQHMLTSSSVQHQILAEENKSRPLEFLVSVLYFTLKGENKQVHV